MITAAVLVLVALALGLWPEGRRAALASRPRSGVVGMLAEARARLGRRPIGRAETMGVAAAAAFVLATAMPPHAAVCGGILAFIAAGAWARSRRRKASAVQAAAEADSLHALAAELRAGHAIAEAFRATASQSQARIGRSLQRAAQAVELGEDPADALDRASHERAARQLSGLIRLASAHGVALAEAVDVLAVESSERLRRRRDLAGLLAGPRATAHLLAALPLFGIVMGESIGAHPLDTLLHTSTGAIVMLAGVGLAAAGVLWTHSLVARAEP